MDGPGPVARLQVLAAALLFSTGGAVIKAVSLSGWQVACLRSAVAATALWVMLPGARRRWTGSTLLVGVAYAGALITYVLANRLTTAASTIFLQSTAPLYLLFLGPWLLREPLRRRDLLFMVALAAGLALFFAEPDPPSATAPWPLAGNLLAALGGVFWALALTGLRAMGREGARPGAAESAVVAGNVIALVACLPLAWPVSGAAAADWLLIGYLGVVQIGLAYVFLTRGLRRVPALEASLLLLIEPVLNPLWAWWLHGERPGGWALAGGALILTATALHTLGAFRRRGR